SLYFMRQSAARQGPERIRRIGPDGLLSTVAGPGTNTVFQENGGPATESRIGLIQYLTVGRDGSIYFTERTQKTLRKVGPDGNITTLAGLGTIVSPENGELGNQAKYNELRGIALAPDGSVVFAVNSDGHVRSVQPTRPLAALGQFVASHPNGQEIYVFDLLGSHLRTLDAFTGRTNYLFGYDNNHLLASVTDLDGLVTRIERDALGRPMAILAPFGQRTSLALDQYGYLASATLPAGGLYQMTYYDENGLLAS